MSIYLDNKYIRLVSYRLRNFKQKRDNLYNFSCPICGDSHKKQSKARGYIYKKEDNLFYMCQNCKCGMNLPHFLEIIDPILQKEYIMERFTDNSTQKNLTQDIYKKYTVPSCKFGKLKKHNIFNNAELCSTLPPDHLCIRYLEERKISSVLYGNFLYTPNFRVFMDELFPDHNRDLYEDARLVIPFYNEYNDIIAASGRSLGDDPKKIKYITVKRDDLIDKLIYGLDRVDKTRLVKIVEGPIDSLLLDNCIASCDANLVTAAKKVGCSCVLIFDNEKRNKDIIHMMEKAIKERFSLVIWPSNIKCKDINEMFKAGMSISDIEGVIDSNTYSGLEALTTLVFWKKVK